MKWDCYKKRTWCFPIVWSDHNYANSIRNVTTYRCLRLRAATVENVVVSLDRLINSAQLSHCPSTTMKMHHNSPWRVTQLSILGNIDAEPAFSCCSRIHLDFESILVACHQHQYTYGINQMSNGSLVVGIS